MDFALTGGHCRGGRYRCRCRGHAQAHQPHVIAIVLSRLLGAVHHRVVVAAEPADRQGGGEVQSAMAASYATADINIARANVGCYG